MPSSGWTDSRAATPFQITPKHRAVVLEVEIDMPRARPRHAADLAAHADAAELALDHPLDRAESSETENSGAFRPSRGGVVDPGRTWGLACVWSIVGTLERAQPAAKRKGAMNILILGGGGREHALAWAAMQNPKCDRLIVAPGNAGIARDRRMRPRSTSSTDPRWRGSSRGPNAIEFVIIGPEAPLAAGVADRLRAAGLRSSGRRRRGAAGGVEKLHQGGLRACGRADRGLCRKLSPIAAARGPYRDQGAPIVVKADGLAAGKGVIVAETVDEAHGPRRHVRRRVWRSRAPRW